MKRSRSINLVLIGSVSLLALAACDQSDVLTENSFFKDEAACAAKNNADACRQALADARQEHLKTAPYFANREECEAQFGESNCMNSKELQVPSANAQPSTSPSGTPSTTPNSQTASAGGGWFMPLMMGYMMGRTGGGMFGQPVYRDTDNRAYTGTKPIGRLPLRHGLDAAAARAGVQRRPRRLRPLGGRYLVLQLIPSLPHKTGSTWNG
jgi:uncharacterized protein YgiB involved in biofilm formation